ncbi:hypothetical protein S40285_10434 [Stachybotrys chlorohalonatus IBT 40285]|uniref:Uncharacterized protein n=1 Tax=Stachybotrys chlorohalonatus (strain IBT 40285) TaxID=1283841 RepID=A0A084R1Q1_STAC4|nr:hypothetical protein S40285_10434 [Stachybotrys chlorohalonata IBT 40285]
MSGTSSNRTDVWVLSGASGFQKITRKVETGHLETSAAQFDFALVEWNADGTLDLVVIRKNGTGSNSTEVHILSGASNFQKFILQTGTVLPETDETFSFGTGKCGTGCKPDLFAIKKSKISTNRTEVHVLSGASGSQDYVLQKGTALEETGAMHDFLVADWNADRCPGLIAVRKSDSTSKSTDGHQPIRNLSCTKKRH